MSESDVLKMKVADLKRELKIRGLPLTGNKTELQERLQSVLLDGDLSLDDTAISEDVLLDEDVLTDEEEEVPVSQLKEPTYNSISSTTGADKITEIGTTSIPLTELKNEDDNNHLKKPVVLKRKLITLATCLNNSSDEQQITSVGDFESSAPAKLKKNDITIENNNDNIESTDEKRILKVNQLTLKERMDMRAKKFGVSSSETAATTTSSSSTINGNKNIIKEKIDISDPKTIEALKKRAERFGIISPETNAIEKAEKLQKRKERFGISGGDNTAKDSNTDYAEKAKLRLERFKAAAANL